MKYLKELVFVFVLTAVAYTLVYACISTFRSWDSRIKKSAKQTVTDIKERISYATSRGFDAGYEKGVNHALDSITMLNLEQWMQGTNRTYGQMGEIVADRLKVKRVKFGGTITNLP